MPKDPENDHPAGLNRLNWIYRLNTLTPEAIAAFPGTGYIICALGVEQRE